MKLYENGAYLIQGKDVVLDSPEALLEVKSKTGKDKRQEHYSQTESRQRRTRRSQGRDRRKASGRHRHGQACRPSQKGQ